MTLAIVVARSTNGVIGRGNEIPWRARGEQKLFKEITDGGTLVMGRKTFESIGRPLPGRETIIITRNSDFSFPGCHIAHSLDEALARASEQDRPVFVVGGGEIYQEALPHVDEVHLSTIAITVDGDTYFENFPTPDFELVSERHFESNINYIYQHYRRRQD